MSRRLTIAAVTALALALAACTSPTAPAPSPTVNLECGHTSGSSTRC